MKWKDQDGIELCRGQFVDGIYRIAEHEDGETYAVAWGISQFPKWTAIATWGTRRNQQPFAAVCGYETREEAMASACRIVEAKFHNESLKP